MNNNNEFYKYATKHRGINGLGLEKYANTITDYISPTIIEERQLNVAQMDVFSRLMMDRISSWATRSTTMSLTSSRLSCSSSSRPTQNATFRFT